MWGIVLQKLILRRPCLDTFSNLQYTAVRMTVSDQTQNLVLGSTHGVTFRGRKFNQ